MRGAVYNLGIPDIILNSADLRAALRPAYIRCSFFFVSARCWRSLPVAADWSGPEQQLARKIVAVTGPGAVALTVENRSSLGRRDSDDRAKRIAQLRSKGSGIRFVKAEQAAATVAISLSENPTSYVWVAEIHQGAGESQRWSWFRRRAREYAIAMHESVPLTLRKTFFVDVRTNQSSTWLCSRKIRLHHAHRGAGRGKSFALPNVRAGSGSRSRALGITHRGPGRGICAGG